MKMKLLWGLAPLVLAGMGAVQAEGVRMYRADEVPNASDIANMLRGGAAASHKPKMRGIALDPAYQKPAPAPAPAPSAVYHAPEPAAPAVATAEPAEGAFALPVRFGFNSAEIQPDAMPQLDAVAEGIKLVPEARVVIEGHTDASGSNAYNQRLSYRRASAVKQYLVYRHGIRSQSLVVIGKGEDEPLDPANPYAPENRRVQFRAAQ
jgi:outer membrane protein OmpA-like peptidoglycan-associated protein